MCDFLKEVPSLFRFVFNGFKKTNKKPTTNIPVLQQTLPALMVFIKNKQANVQFSPQVFAFLIRKKET